MVGRKEYTRAELDVGKERIKRGLADFRRLAKSIKGSGDEGSAAALAKFEASYFNGLALALDRHYAYRLRVVSGKDTNPLNELELIVTSLVANDGVMQAGRVIKYDPAEAVIGIKEGEAIELSGKDFEKLSAAFFDELERKFV